MPDTARGCASVSVPTKISIGSGKNSGKSCKGGSMTRKATIRRETGETKIGLMLELDGTGQSHIRTGVGFFDHMLTLFSRHGLFDLEVDAEGDLHVDAHHVVEDVGIC